MSMLYGGSAVEQTPKDATRATEEQRDLQEKLEHQDDDPDAPARSQSRHQIPDES